MPLSIKEFVNKIAKDIPPVTINDIIVTPEYSFVLAKKEEINEFKSNNKVKDILVVDTIKIPGAVPKLKHIIRKLAAENDTKKLKLIESEVLEKLYIAFKDLPDPNVQDIYGTRVTPQTGDREELTFWVPIHNLGHEYSSILVSCNRDKRPHLDRWKILIKGFKLVE